MTYGEIRAMLKRSDPRKLRVEAGISIRTVARALHVPVQYVYRWEARRTEPWCPAGLRWARFTAALERHAQVRDW